MSKKLQQRALRAGLTVKQCRRGSILIDPETGKSVYRGNRSIKSYHCERRIEAFLRKAENAARAPQQN
jgi:hypothetical protein